MGGQRFDWGQQGVAPELDRKFRRPENLYSAMIGGDEDGRRSPTPNC